MSHAVAGAGGEAGVAGDAARRAAGRRMSAGAALPVHGPVLPERGLPLPQCLRALQGRDPLLVAVLHECSKFELEISTTESVRLLAEATQEGHFVFLCRSRQITDAFITHELVHSFHGGIVGLEREPNVPGDGVPARRLVRVRRRRRVLGKPARAARRRRRRRQLPTRSTRCVPAAETAPSGYAQTEHTPRFVCAGPCVL